MSSLPPVKWAQRKDSLYVTIQLPDVADAVVSLTEDSIVFNGTSGKKEYSITMKLFKGIDAEGSKWNALPMNVQMKLMKANQDEEFWPRLLQDKTLEKTNVKVDWDRYVDEDEEKAGFDMDGMGGANDFGGGMGGMGGGMGGMGGMGGGMGGMDMEAMMRQMGGMGGMGGAGMGGGMDDMDDGPDGDAGDDEDDEDDLPDLESTAPQ